MSQKLPTTLQEAVQYFADPQRTLDFVMALRWPKGPVCPRCQSLEHRFMSALSSIQGKRMEYKDLIGQTTL